MVHFVVKGGDVSFGTIHEKVRHKYKNKSSEVEAKAKSLNPLKQEAKHRSIFISKISEDGSQ